MRVKEGRLQKEHSRLAPFDQKKATEGEKKTHDEGQDLSIAEMLDVWAREEKSEQRKMQEMQASLASRNE